MYVNIKTQKDGLNFSMRKKNCRALLIKMLKLRVLDLFFHLNNLFVITQKVKYRKKVPLGTEFQILIPVPYQFKCERYPTLHVIMHNLFVL